MLNPSYLHHNSILSPLITGELLEQDLVSSSAQTSSASSIYQYDSSDAETQTDVSGEYVSIPQQNCLLGSLMSRHNHGITKTVS